MVLIYVDCGSAGCYRVGTWAQAGYCGADRVVAALSLAPQDPASGRVENIAYVNAYVRNCQGQYVAVRMPIERQIT